MNADKTDLGASLAAVNDSCGTRLFLEWCCGTPLPRYARSLGGAASAMSRLARSLAFAWQADADCSWSGAATEDDPRTVQDWA